MIDINKELDDLWNRADQQTKIEAILSSFAHQFVLCPPFFKSATDLPSLKWKSMSFGSPHTKLPEQQGVYAFAVQIGLPNLPINSYILYVGKAGDTDSHNTLRSRYRDYMRELNHMTRKRIHRMLNNWKGHLTYHYAEVPNGKSTEDVEKCLTTIFVPPYCRGDFTAQVGSLLRGSNLI